MESLNRADERMTFVVWGLTAVLAERIAWAVAIVASGLVYRWLASAGVSGSMLAVAYVGARLGVFVLSVVAGCWFGLVGWFTSGGWERVVRRHLWLVAGLVVLAMLAELSGITMTIQGGQTFDESVSFARMQSGLNFLWNLAFPILVCLLLRWAFRFRDAVRDRRDAVSATVVNRVALLEGAVQGKAEV